MVWICRLIAWALAITIVVLSLVPPSLRPETNLPHTAEHFAIFVAAGLMFALGYSRSHIMLGFRLIAFDAVIELAQLLVPGRHARIGDFLVDAVATSVGVISVSVASWRGARLGC